MPQRLPKRHFQTFARLRAAHIDEVSALEALEAHVSSGSAKLDWSRLVASAGVLVIVAHEGESLVGAAIVEHRGSAATAKLVWLGVCPSGRSRGVGALLLDEVIAALRDRSAAVVLADAPTGDNHLSRLLLSGGFECQSTEANTARYKRLLWRRSEPDTVIRVSFA